MKINRSLTSPELAKAIGSELQHARTTKHLSRADLARLLDLDLSYLGMIERGVRVPGIALLFKFCDLLDLKPEELIANVRKSLKR
jgi:transcriptional regulator with XRE-family HTH domain